MDLPYRANPHLPASAPVVVGADGCEASERGSERVHSMASNGAYLGSISATRPCRNGRSVNESSARYSADR
jgi:hypothetical protein